MNFEDIFPQRYYLNLGRADERRQTVEAHFYESGLTVQRMPAVRAAWLRDSAGYPDTMRRALALTKRLVIRRAQCTGAESVFFFEDDVVLHPDWRASLSKITLPEDWGIFMLGAFHEKPPEDIGGGLVRCAHTVDHHAIGIRSSFFQTIRRLWRGSRTPGAGGGFSDQRLATLQSQIPTYACWPNLAWQSGRDAHSNYDDAGRQRFRRENIAHLTVN
jgi:hypothetical protein